MPAAKTHPDGSLRNSAPLRVLVVDDCRDASFPVQRLLELDGHQVRVAADGPSGIAMARQFRPQLVLCDLDLAGETSGYDVARALRGDPELHCVYLVAVTGYSGGDEQEQAAQAGFDRHLTKPVGQVELRVLVAGLARNSSHDVDDIGAGHP
jgi:CheY-like chemotaxis protein